MRLYDDSLDLILGQSRSRRNAHSLFTARRFISRRNRDNAVGVHFERDFDLRNAARGRRNPDQFKLAQTAIVARNLAFTLEDMNLYGRLIVHHGREGQAVAQWNRGVTLDDLG